MRKVLVTGASGLIGGALERSLAARGVAVFRLVRDRGSAGPNAVFWRPGAEKPVENLDQLEGCDAAVHLAGANVAGRRWDEDYRRIILNSRVETSQALRRVLAELQTRPKVLVAASATGIYGDRGDEILTENSGPGTGFLAQVCRQWEAATSGAEQPGLRVVQLRFGVVLSPQGGALKTMLPVFRAGIGGRLGSGKQWMSWLTLPDAVRAIEFALERGDASGAYNAVGPSPVTNAAWTEVLARTVHRPAILVVPRLALRAAFGQMAEDTMLASTRALPARLQSAGFQFLHERLEAALPALLDGA